MARAAVVMSVSGRAIERPAISGEERADQQGEERGARHRALRARRTMSSTWLRSAATRIAPGPPGTAT